MSNAVAHTRLMLEIGQWLFYGDAGTEILDVFNFATCYCRWNRSRKRGYDNDKYKYLTIKFVIVFFKGFVLKSQEISI